VVPKFVSDVLSAGARYLPPQATNKKLVLEAWDNLVPILKRDWEYYYILETQNHPAKSEKYSIPVPVPPFSKGPPQDLDHGDDFQAALDKGRSVLAAQVQEAPFILRESRQQALDTSAAFAWLAENRVLVKQTDKNLGTVVVPVDWYQEKVIDFLTSGGSYEEISEYAAQEAYARICVDLSRLAGHPCARATPGLAKFLLHKIDENDKEEFAVKIPVFHALPKIHKKQWGIRPIVPCFAAPQGPASMYLSQVLKKLLPQFETILVSSKHLVIEMERVNSTILKTTPFFGEGGNYYLCTGDVVGFYPNIEIQEARRIVSELVYSFFGNLEYGISITEFITKLFSVQQEDLVFKVITADFVTFYKQTNGLSMGLSAAPDIANLYAAYFERRFPHTFMNRCLIYKRYMDDIFCLLRASSRSHAEQLLKEHVKFPGLEVTWDISQQSCVFLDMEITLKKRWPGGEIQYKPYRKPFNNFERLPYITGHPLRMLKAAFKSEVYRIAVLSSTPEIYARELLWLEQLYLSRSYPEKVIYGWCKRFRAQAYSNRLILSSRVEIDKPEEFGVWPLKSLINPVWDSVVVSKVHDAFIDTLALHMQLNPGIVEGFSRRMVASLRRPVNLGDVANAHNKSVIMYPPEADTLLIPEAPSGRGVQTAFGLQPDSDDEQDQDMDITD